MKTEDLKNKKIINTVLQLMLKILDLQKVLNEETIRFISNIKKEPKMDVRMET